MARPLHSARPQRFVIDALSQSRSQTPLSAGRKLRCPANMLVRNASTKRPQATVCYDLGLNNVSQHAVGLSSNSTIMTAMHTGIQDIYYNPCASEGPCPCVAAPASRSLAFPVPTQPRTDQPECV
jgi:hypothetical protein